VQARDELLAAYRRARDHARPLAELRQAPDQVIERAAGHQGITAAEGGDEPLPDLAGLAVGLDDLQVLADGPRGTTTLEAHEHALIMRGDDGRTKQNRGAGHRRRATTFRPASRRRAAQRRAGAAITRGAPSPKC
jgi:hypothetical protein